jgi:hypothetical protein
MKDTEGWEAARNKYRDKLRAVIDGRPITGVHMTPEEAKAILATFEEQHKQK